MFKDDEKYTIFLSQYNVNLLCLVFYIIRLNFLIFLRISSINTSLFNNFQNLNLFTFDKNLKYEKRGKRRENKILKDTIYLKRIVSKNK